MKLCTPSRLRELTARAARSVPRATRSVPRATRSVPRAARTVPRATRSVPRATRTVPCAARSVPRAALLLFLALGGCAPVRVQVAAAPALPELARQVEIRRSAYGVPHIRAENLRAAAFALAWVQLEDHGARVIEQMHAERGRMALVRGEALVDADARARLRHAHAVAMFPLLEQDTRDVYEGFAAGMNHFIRVHSADLPTWMEPDFTAQDVFTRDLHAPAEATINNFRERLLGARPPRETEPDTAAVNADSAGRDPAANDAGRDPAAAGIRDDDVGSNAWALAPSRTTSGHAILLRNPHLAWTAGYYEAHIRVPGKLDFYGDFRIGGPFTVIGGFNRSLGFSTTNNATRSHEFYALRLDPGDPGRVLLDGESRPLQRERAVVEYRTADGRTASAAREFLNLDGHPVVHRSDSLAYVYRHGASGEFRAGEQWLRMMKAQNLAEWQDAMRIGARTRSNFTYADRAGNIFYVWVATAPLLPHAPGGDTAAIRVSRATEMWTRVAPFDSLPQLLNPPGGYVRNENDSPHYTNMNAVMPHAFSFEVQPPQLRLRSQHGLQLLHNDRLFSLEEVVAAKHSMRMLIADRMKDELITVVRAAADGGAHAAAVPAALSSSTTAAQLGSALDLLAAWDNTVAAESRGAVLFETWVNRYRTLMRGADMFAVEWTAAAPRSTPRGIADPGRAVEAFVWAVANTHQSFGAWDVAWGDVHRVRRGGVDVPVGGCSGALGCFRVLTFATAEDGRRVVTGGDGWVLAVEFGDEPRAYSVLAYGQVPDPLSPWHADQAALFAANRMKRVLWTEAEIEAGTVVRYHPGEPRPHVATLPPPQR
jgi:acyl-homoserine-lactone acylase